MCFMIVFVGCCGHMQREYLDLCYRAYTTGHVCLEHHVYPRNMTWACRDCRHNVALDEEEKAQRSDPSSPLSTGKARPALRRVPTEPPSAAHDPRPDYMKSPWLAWDNTPRKADRALGDAAHFMTLRQLYACRDQTSPREELRDEMVMNPA